MLTITFSVAAGTGPVPSAARAATVAVDGTDERQTWYGFGATHTSEVFGTTDVLTPAQRAQMLDLLYNQIKLRTGQIPNLFEAPQSAGPDFFGQQANDNADPFSINWPGFTTFLMDTYKAKVIDLAPPGTTGDLYPSQNINTRWSSQWLELIRPVDYERFLNECAEQVLAGITKFVERYGREPEFDMLYNEPTSGNGELQNGNDTIIRDIVRRSGDRLRGAGFDQVKFVLPAQETEETSLSTATFVCADPTARQYVGAIAYHTYPYGSMYSYIPNILARSGNGNPPADRIAVRNQLRDLGAQYGIPVWMTEVSNGFYGDNTPSNMESFDALRGRAIHIHDELLYAEASAFFGMESDWSLRANELHGLGSAYGSNPDDLVFTDQDQDRTFISGTGRAVGHYARFIGKGASVLASTTDDALVLATAFRDPTSGKFVLVVINNATQSKPLQVNLAGLSLTGDVSGESSTSGGYWEVIAPFPPSSGSGFSLTLPARSVTTLAALLSSSSSTESTPTASARVEEIRPNPITRGAAIRWSTPSREGSTPSRERLRLSIRDVSGREVRVLFDQAEVPAGFGSSYWDLLDRRGEPVPSGVYMLDLWSSTGRQTRRVIVVR